MNSQSRMVPWVMWGALGLVILSIGGVFLTSLLRPRPDPLPVLGTVPEFRLTNQLGRAVTRSDLLGHVWIADIIFTRCSGPCLEMTRKMKSIQEALPPDGSIRLLSLTADPAFDSTGVLAEYAKRFEVAGANWLFLTGPRKPLYELAMNGLKLAVQENTGSPAEGDQFIHSTRLVLLDRQGRLRSVSFDGSEAQSTRAVVDAAKQLLRER